MKNKIAIYSSNNEEENKEIIKILESLGGENRFLTGNASGLSCYYIEENNTIYCIYLEHINKFLKNYKLYTLEEYKRDFMESKEIKITPPEGYEIDKENSTFEKIVFKKTEKKLTYEDIVKKLFEYKINYFIAIDGSIKKSYTGYKCPNTSPTKHQLERLLAINKLMNVAYYLNDGWEPDWENLSEYKYYLTYSYNILHVDLTTLYNRGQVFFKSKELAQQAVEILGEETIKLALGVI